MTGPAASRLVVFGIDPHKATHTVAAVDEVGRQVDQRTVAARTPQHLELLGWARTTAGDGDRVWAVEDCRHLSRRLERDLLAPGGGVWALDINLTPALTQPSMWAQSTHTPLT